jgi:high-affinity iron transporter
MSDGAAAALAAAAPAEWLKRNTAADFDVILASLNSMETAARAGEYDLAESARLDAYALLETGPEARLSAFAPQYVVPIEELFWQGRDGRAGLAELIRAQAPPGDIQAAGAELKQLLAEAQSALEQTSSPEATATSAAVIVMREGMEAVLILASLMGSLKAAAQRKFRRPMWAGAGLAAVATAATWVAAQGALMMLARYGEMLEAIVSAIAVGVLLLVMNWFFHDVYWTGWMANFHARKRRVLSGAAGQVLGLAVLGFTSVYREGFETVLFLQALALESGAHIVLGGAAAGLAVTLALGWATFSLQARLPYKKMLVATGILIGLVLVTMAGKTVHAFQVVGWMPISPIRALVAPHWLSLWFGVFATWQGVAAQAGAIAFTVGSYFLAERLRARPARAAAAAERQRQPTGMAQ